MIRKVLILSFAVLVFGSSLAMFPARSEARNASGNTITAKSSKVQSRRFGPYATLRRANEVANYARRQGYNAKVIYGGSVIYNTREYYVDVWR